MRNMSFAITTQQARDKQKDVTRRLGWWNLKTGDRFQQVVKGMGLKKGEKVEKIHIVEVVSTRAELLCAITADDCRREGFPDKTPEQFISMFMEHNADKCKKNGRLTTVNRIEFKYL